MLPARPAPAGGAPKAAIAIGDFPVKAANAGLALAGSVVASDAFFPFRDGLDVVVDAGAVAVIQPGGSMRDDEVITAANERGIAMVLTGVRHFRH